MSDVDARIHHPVERLKLVEFWQTELQKLSEQPKKVFDGLTLDRAKSGGIDDVDRFRKINERLAVVSSQKHE